MSSNQEFQVQTPKTNLLQQTIGIKKNKKYSCNDLNYIKKQLIQNAFKLNENSY